MNDNSCKCVYIGNIGLAREYHERFNQIRSDYKAKNIKFAFKIIDT